MLPTDTELVNTEALLLKGNTRLGSCEPLVIFLSTDQYITLFMFLFKDTCNIHCKFINIEPMALNEACLRHIFS